MIFSHLLGPIFAILLLINTPELEEPAPIILHLPFNPLEMTYDERSGLAVEFAWEMADEFGYDDVIVWMNGDGETFFIHYYCGNDPNPVNIEPFVLIPEGIHAIDPRYHYGCPFSL